MEEEQLAVFDEYGNRIGVASRSEVHLKGYWHETFHCWLAHYDESSGETYIYFQLRSDKKKDFPGLLDITAAGHILSEEKIEDGVREVHEELGLLIKIDELQSLGIVKGELDQRDMIDRELTHVFLYSKPVAYDEFQLQLEEVSGIFRTTLQDFKALVQQTKAEIEVEGFHINETGKTDFIKQRVSYHHYVPHERSYLLEIIARISAHL
ncbi:MULTISPECIES: NUDIX domain-containing protein [unclassified Rossellomorea]|uniref:NUDIX hydrolase n=1 Tax=unclassified Rossellomorea TaxID=2837526 RepID=UPI00261CAA45|nr:NUDIX domain-containing protein [uncultured Rossellomorea sp.]